MTDIDVTDRVKLASSPDDEALPLAQCVCGHTFDRWTAILCVGREDPFRCEGCGRLLYWTQTIRVFEVSEGMNGQEKT